MVTKFKDLLLKIYKSFRRSDAPFEHLAQVALATQSFDSYDRSHAAIYTTGLFSLNMVESSSSNASTANFYLNGEEDEDNVPKVQTNQSEIDTIQVVNDQSILQGVVNLEDTTDLDIPFKDTESNIKQDKDEIETVEQEVERYHLEEFESEKVDKEHESLEEEGTISHDFANDIFETVPNKSEETSENFVNPHSEVAASKIMWEELEEESLKTEDKKDKKRNKKKSKKKKKNKARTTKTSVKTNKDADHKKKKKELKGKKKQKKNKLKNRSKSKIKKNKSIKKNQNTAGLTTYGDFESSKFTSWLYDLKPLEGSKFIDASLKQKVSKKKKKKKKKQKHKAVKDSALKSITLKENIASETLVNILISQGHYDQAIDMLDTLMEQQPQDATRLSILKQSLLGK